MSDDKKWTQIATGSMSKGAGTTTQVRISQPQLDPQDKKVLCSAMCQCDKAPNIGKDGQQLKQACVSERMKALDKLLEHRSPYKQEINYDMTKRPPAPIMDSAVETKGHSYLPGWIQKYWNSDGTKPPFQAGEGMIRRPDIVIVNDPAKPPTQDNIKQIVEMKFPPDTATVEQREDYKTIAGSSNKLRILKPSDCDCDAPDPNPPKIPVETLGWAATIASILLSIGSRGKGGPTPVMP